MSALASQTRPVHVPVAVIGAGQAGLSASYYLEQRGVEHVIFERHRTGHAWRDRRWDSFCLVTPNWQCELPGFSYTRDFGGTDPDGFMNKQQILDYLAAYVERFSPPLREGVSVTRVRRGPGGGFQLETSIGPFSADQLIVAAGNYHIPRVPELAAQLPAQIIQLHSSEYRNAGTLPEGAVLVVGTGQSGCQIAEDLHLAGRRVHLCTGSAPRVARRYRGRDVVAWLAQMGYYDLPVHDHPLKEGVRAKANHYVTGRDGGRDIDLRLFALQGMQLHGRLCGIDGTLLRFGDDLERNLDAADATSESIKRSIDAFIEQSGIEAPLEPPYVPLWRPVDPARELDYVRAQIGSVVWSMGYRSDFGFIELPIFDTRGYPRHERGVTPARGLYFLGLPWLFTWGSGRFSGIARDAAFVVEQIMSVRTALTGDAMNALGGAP
jgi:putative flavoprotein involved in K+ transport